MIKDDCIYLQQDKDNSANLVCLYKRSLITPDDHTCCDLCRIWDAYIPENASAAEKEKAMHWQNMSYNEQPDYDEYFN